MDHLLQVNQIPLTAKFYPAADPQKLRGTWYMRANLVCDRMQSIIQ